MTRRTRRSPKKNHYFTSVTEQAIVDYCATECLTQRTRLYVDHIQPAFNEMVDKIVYTYKFTSLENVDLYKDECKIWLTTILGKFKPDNGAKAFSYFSVVTKNWFTHKAKKQNQKNRREIHYDTMIREIETMPAGSMDFYSERETEEYWAFLLKEVKKWQTLPLKPNEEKVLNAVLTLMENIEQIDIFNKKAIYLYLREITGLNTKQIVSCLNKMRIKYRNFKKKWDQGEIL